MLRCNGVTVRFGGLVALDSLDLELPDRGITMLVGPNGAGKTTFINVITRLYTPVSGTVTVDGTDLLALSPDQVIGAGVARSFQKAELFAGMTALENVLVGLYAIYGWREERAARARAEAVLAAVGLAQVADQTAGALPYGYQKILDVARAIAGQPKVLLLDEPFAGVTQAEVPDLLRCVEQQGRERAVLMVEHHLDIVMDLAQRVTVIDFGKKVAEGTPDEIRRDPNVIRSYLGTRAGR